MMAGHHPVASRWPGRRHGGRVTSDMSVDSAVDGVLGVLGVDVVYVVGMAVAESVAGVERVERVKGCTADRVQQCARTGMGALPTAGT